MLSSHRLGIAAAWACIWLLFGRILLVFLPIPVLIGIISLIWSGMVFAISFLEAWVKFGAPLLTKPVAVDVGRRVFAALNAAELAHLSAIAGWMTWGKGKSDSTMWGVVFLLAIFLFSQIYWLTPALDSMALRVIAVAKPNEIPGSKSEIQKQLGRRELAARRPVLHLGYVLLEGIKVVLLGFLAAWSLQVAYVRKDCSS